MKTEAINRKIAEPYAEALMALAEEQNAMDAIAADVAVIVNATGQVGELAQMLASPIMPARLKKEKKNNNKKHKNER
jgi:F0F1-type ATP synthase delta subunit